MLDDALTSRSNADLGVTDAARHPISSRDWDEVQEFCRVAYMHYRVRPLERGARPDAVMRSARAGRVLFTRFRYGTPIYLDQFDPSHGNVLVLNTLRGALRHSETREPATTRSGESFVVDCSRTPYWLEGDGAHLQLNLTISHDTLEETARSWFGGVPNDRLWTARRKIGGGGSRWLLLLEYAAKTLDASGGSPLDARLGAHLEEMLCVELLRSWAERADVVLDGGVPAPRHVRQAEEILRAEAKEAPRIASVAERVGVSARSLSEGFRQFRGVSPRAFLAERRLEGARADLTDANPSESVAEIATRWGYSNLGAFAGAYEKRFGELPSATLRRGR